MFPHGNLPFIVILLHCFINIHILICICKKLSDSRAWLLPLILGFVTIINNAYVLFKYTILSRAHCTLVTEMSHFPVVDHMHLM